MKYLALAILALACTTSAAVAQQDTLYGPRGFLGGVRADAFEIIRYCQAKYPRNNIDGLPDGMLHGSEYAGSVESDDYIRRWLH